LDPGDLLRTDTLSGLTVDGYGSLIEIGNAGTTPINMPSWDLRSFVDDGDEVLLSATANAVGFMSIGFGECRAVLLPAS
jgi:fumarylacetoacetase